MRRIAVLTSGGDAPGMNAAVRAVVRAADAAGIETYRVRRGYEGLIDGDLAPLDARAVSGVLHLGGTVLGTARSARFLTAEGRAQAAASLRAHGVEGLVVIGGDGSFRGAVALAREHGIRVTGVPGTIDNDLWGTDFTLGFDTAVNTALGLIDRIRDTALSHGRLFFVEVMGRNSGWLALFSALAGGATDVLVPEQPTDLERVRRKVQGAFDIGKGFCIVVVAEGDDEGSVYEIAAKVSDGLGVEHRVTALGHVQRGGPPTMRDRVLGAMLGDAAVQALREGQDQVMAGDVCGRVVCTPLERTWSEAKPLPPELLALLDRLAR